MSREPTRITNWIENVPVRAVDGTVVGRARVSDRGEIQAAITWEDGYGPSGFYELLTDGTYDHLSILAQNSPEMPKQPEVKYSDTVREYFDKKKEQ